MQQIHGNLLTLATSGHFDLIVHGCNCFCTMGAGIAKQIKATFPEAYKVDLETEKGDSQKLGTISSAVVNKDDHKIIIVNGYTQFDYRGTGRKVDYDAIRSVFRTIKQQFSGLRIGYPLIGAGLAGGDWKIISKIIDEELIDEQHTLVIYAG